MRLAVSTFRPTPDDLAREELLDDLCAQFRKERDTDQRFAILHSYRELKAQRTPEFVQHLNQASGRMM